MKIKLTVFLLTIGTLILLLVGCKGFGAINNTIPTLQDAKVILNPVNSEYGLNAIDDFVNFPGTSEEDRSHLEAMKEIKAAMDEHPEVFVRCASEFPFYPAAQQLVKWYREGAFGLGAGKWRVIRTVVLPNCVEGVITGCILCASRKKYAHEK